MREGGGGDKSGGMYEGNGMEWDIPRYFRYLLTLLFVFYFFQHAKIILLWQVKYRYVYGGLNLVSFFVV